MTTSKDTLLKTPLHDLHAELGARMVPFAGYSMPVQYPAGLMAEHLHTRAAAGLFDVSHMGQLRLEGTGAAAAFESLMPVDVIDLPAGKQRYGLLLNDAGGIMDDLMFFNTGDALFVIVNGACKAQDIAHISVHADQADKLARALLAQPEVKPVGLGARNSLRLEAGLCLYGNDIDSTTTPVEASLNWAIQKVRREGGARAGGFPGAEKILAQLSDPVTLTRKRVGLMALERIPVRDHTALHALTGQAIGQVSSGLLGPSINQPVAMAYVGPEFATIGTQVHAMVRGKPVLMQVAALPFVANHYFRG